MWLSHTVTVMILSTDRCWNVIVLVVTTAAGWNLLMETRIDVTWLEDVSCSLSPCRLNQTACISHSVMSPHCLMPFPLLFNPYCLRDCCCFWTSPLSSLNPPSAGSLVGWFVWCYTTLFGLSFYLALTAVGCMLLKLNTCLPSFPRSQPATLSHTDSPRETSQILNIRSEDSEKKGRMAVADCSLWVLSDSELFSRAHHDWWWGCRWWSDNRGLWVGSLGPGLWVGPALQSQSSFMNIVAASLASASWPGGEP